MQGRTCEGGKGELEAGPYVGGREREGGEIDGIGRADLYQTRGAIRRADTKQKTIGRDGTRRTGGIGRAADIRRAEVSRGGEVSDARRYQTRGEADRVQGRTWEGGKGEEDR